MPARPRGLAGLFRARRARPGAGELRSRPPGDGRLRLTLLACLRTLGATAPTPWGDAVIQVRVANLAMDPKTESPVVLLEGVETKGVMPIWIGPPEANAILMQLAGQTFERPLTHDLLRIVIE